MKRKLLFIPSLVFVALLQGCDNPPPLSNERFILDQKGTVIDQESGLMWMQCSLGQQWRRNACEGEPVKVSWNKANHELQPHQFAGFSDWRLPTIDELSSIVFCSTGRTELERPDERFQRKTDGRCVEGNYQTPTINLAVFPNTPADWFWSSSPFVHHERDAWGLNFAEGNVSWGVRGNESHVRLVRNTK